MISPSETETARHRLLHGLAAIDEFMQQVGAMRTAQKLYFRTRSQTYLRTSKALEKEVDEWLRVWSASE